MIRNKPAKLIGYAAALAIAVAMILYFRDPLAVQFKDFAQKLNFAIRTEISSFTPPCRKPILYSIGAIDPRFNVDRTQLLSALKTAADIWSAPLGRELFAYDAGGELKINMAYDYRQEATDKLKKLGIVVSNDQKSYDGLKARYDALNSEYQAQKALLVSLTADFKRKQAAYEAEVQKWNKRGGAPEAAYDSLNRTRDDLNAEVSRINALSSQVNALADDLNAAGTVLNKLIEQLNLNVNRYNNVGSATAKEFQEGVYTEGPEGKAVIVFEFSNREQLIRLLAHELGHALGLGHTGGSADIMYYLNEGANDKLTANDLAAISAVCRLGGAQ